MLWVRKVLRLRPERAELRQRCPVCKTITPHPRHWEFVRERRRFNYALAALGILGLIPLTWPVGLYFEVLVTGRCEEIEKLVRGNFGSKKSRARMPSKRSLGRRFVVGVQGTGVQGTDGT
jgi:hypothetical protein